MGKCKDIGLKVFTIIVDAAFTRVLVPKQCFINNRNLAILQKFLWAMVAGGVAYLLLTTPSQYMVVFVPSGLPRMTSGEATGFFDSATTALGAADGYCDTASNNKHTFIASSGDRFQDPECIHPSYFFDGESDVGVGQLFMPTTIQESFQEHNTSCSFSGGCSAGNWASNESGAQQQNDLGSAGCVCEMIPKTYYVAGVENKTMKFDHTMFVENTISNAVELSVASRTDDANHENGAPGLLSMIMTYNPETEMWEESTCSSSKISQKENQCRFGNGVVPDLSMADWLKAGGVTNLDGQNDMSGMGSNSVTTYDGQTTENYPTYRVSGVELVIQIEYIDNAFHSYSDWEDPETGSIKKFPGVISLLKVQANKMKTTLNKVDNMDIGSTAGSVGKVRYRSMSGISVSTATSPNSKRGVVSNIALVQALAVIAVYFNFMTLIVMFLAIYGLGNTSRNYLRALREQVNVAVQSARRTPAKMIIAACSFFLMREWEQDKEAMHKFMDNHSLVHKSTIRKFMMTCYNPDLLPEIEEEEVEDMVEATWSEMAGAAGEGISLIEFVESALSSETVDYISTRAAFNKDRKKMPLEKMFEDNVGHYDEREKKMCYGLIENPANRADAGERQMRNKLRANLQANIPGLNMGGALMGKGLGAGLNAAGDAMKLGGKAADMLTFGMAGKAGKATANAAKKAADKTGATAAANKATGK